MIIISLFGGLGNQMFQYATGKAIAKELGQELKLDISHLIDRTQRENFTFRDFELDVFNISEKIATIQEVRDYIPDLWNSSKLTKFLYRFIRLIKGTKFYFEKQKFIYEDRIKGVQNNTYLYGYFQTERYFEDYFSEILDSFQLRVIPDELNTELIKKMQSENSVSVHIRRGDYQNSPFNLLEIDDYYSLAIEKIIKSVENPKFYFFTNDYEWIEQNFSEFYIDKTIVKHNQGANSYLDMILMSNCKHNICANSSFSWWGAWLNQNKNKIVITPTKWFKNNTPAQFELIPNQWLKV